MLKEKELLQNRLTNLSDQQILRLLRNTQKTLTKQTCALNGQGNYVFEEEEVENEDYLNYGKEAKFRGLHIY